MRKVSIRTLITLAPNNDLSIT